MMWVSYEAAMLKTRRGKRINVLIWHKLLKVQQMETITDTTYTTHVFVQHLQELGKGKGKR